MSDFFKVSGKKLEIPQSSVELVERFEFETRPGGWVLFTWRDEKGQEVRRRIQVQESRQALGVALDGRVWQGELIRSEGRRAHGGGAGSESDLTAQFPGKVRKVLVSESQSVEEAQTLILMEAMKMEFAVKAPFAGVVKKVLVAEGQSVTPGTKLIELEEGSPS